MTAQLQTVGYVHTMAYTTGACEELAEILVGDRPYGLSKAFFVSSGSEAVDGAMKLARQYFWEKEGPASPRRRFITRRQAYHGNTWGAMGPEYESEQKGAVRRDVCGYCE